MGAFSLIVVINLLNRSMPDFPMSSFKNEYGEERAVEEAISEVSRIAKDMERLDSLFDQFDEKTSSLNSRLEHLLSAEKSMAQSVGQLENSVDTLRLCQSTSHRSNLSDASEDQNPPSITDQNAANLDQSSKNAPPVQGVKCPQSTVSQNAANGNQVSLDAQLTEQSSNLEAFNNLERELQQLLAGSSSTNPAIDLASMGSQIDMLSSQMDAFASRIASIEKVIANADSQTAADANDEQ